MWFGSFSTSWKSTWYFANRPEGFVFPELDRFRSESMVATNAYPPNNATMSSMPALFSGTLLKDAEPISSNELELHAANGSKLLWSTQENIFSKARSEGISAGLVGWYHPYCRVIGNDFDFCAWAPHVGDTNPVPRELSFTNALERDFLTIWWRIPFTYRLFGERYEARKRDDSFAILEEIRGQANVLLQQRMNLTFLHYPIPHSPWLPKGSDKLGPTNGYLSNVLLTDKTLGEVRQQLEEKNLWDSTVVLITGDHWWRDSPLDTKGRRDHRVPFILKLAGQKTRVDYEAKVNTVLTRELLLLILEGKLKTASEVTGWLSSNSHLAESPFTEVLP